MAEKIRIDALNPTTIPQRDHEFPGMRSGIANKIRIAQILSLMETEDIPDDSVTLAKLAADARAAQNHTIATAIANLLGLDPADRNVQKAIEAVAGAVGFRARVDVASAATANIGSAGQRDVRITGTVDIEAFDTADEGVYRDLLFADVLTLTHNATSLILPGSGNIATAAGDTALFRSEGSGNWRCVRYQRAGARSVEVALSGASVDFTGIPEGVKHLTLAFSSLTTSASVSLRLQIGEGSTPKATGYVGMQNNASGSGGGAAGSVFQAQQPSTHIEVTGAATDARSGVVHLERASGTSNLWVASYLSGRDSAIQTSFGHGANALSGALGIVRLSVGSGTFSGSATLSWEF